MYCPVLTDIYETITIAHGGGGKLTQQLIDNLFRKEFDNKLLAQAHDATKLPITDKPLAISTDSYVIKPIFFKGGDIGKLAVCGTINDLLMAGAKPKYLSVSFIIEEGFKINDLVLICQSMANITKQNNISIVTGDTKVVERTSKQPNIFINTTGIGEVFENTDVHPSNIKVNDVIIVSGDIGRHGIAIMAEREGLDFTTPIVSDCCSLQSVVSDLLNQFGNNIHCMRDLTRGGLATACIELASESNYDFCLYENAIPVTQSVNSACEMLGLSPYYCANEGRFVIIIPEDIANDVLSCLDKYESTDKVKAKIIGNVALSKNPNSSRVLLETIYGTKYKLVKQSGEQLPRIC